MFRYLVQSGPAWIINNIDAWWFLFLISALIVHCSWHRRGGKFHRYIPIACRAYQWAVPVRWVRFLNTSAFNYDNKRWSQYSLFISKVSQGYGIINSNLVLTITVLMILNWGKKPKLNCIWHPAHAINCVRANCAMIPSIACILLIPSYLVVYYPSGLIARKVCDVLKTKGNILRLFRAGGGFSGSGGDERSDILSFWVIR